MTEGLNIGLGMNIRISILVCHAAVSGTHSHYLSAVHCNVCLLYTTVVKYYVLCMHIGHIIVHES